MVTEFFSKGWARLDFDPAVLDWVHAARGPAAKAMADPALAQWWQCEDTWFIGVDALDNDAAGAVPGGPDLAGNPKAAIQRLYGDWPQLHKAQISVVRQGYPRPRLDESEAALAYRRDRDAAHVDGLKRLDAGRARVLDETHAWILGLPLTENTLDQSPVVIWEGSHEIMRAALAAALAQHPESDWPLVDLSQPYQAARREVFDSCKRVAVVVSPGAGYVIHRLCLHGMAPWRADVTEEISQRSVAYFRPASQDGIRSWLEQP